MHQKALAKAQAEALKAAHTSQYQQLAEGAMAAAIWQQQGRTAGAAGPAAGKCMQCVGGMQLLHDFATGARSAVLGQLHRQVWVA